MCSLHVTTAETLARSTWPGVGIGLGRWAGEKQLRFLESCGSPQLLLLGCERLLFGCFILSSLCGLGGAGASRVTCLGHATGLGILLDLGRERLCTLAVVEPTGRLCGRLAPGMTRSPGEPLHPWHPQPLLSFRDIQQPQNNSRDACLVHPPLFPTDTLHGLAFAA